MARCDEIRARLLEYQYGLLEPAEAAAVEDHLAACPDCPAALADAAKTRDLFARAAKFSFPEVRFEAPVEPPVVPAAPSPVRRTWPSWVVAAALLLAAFGVAVPVASDWAGYLRHRGEVAAALNALDEAEKAKQRAKDEGDAAVAAARKDREAAEKKHDAAVAKWVAHQIQENAEKALTLTVSGPPSAVPGAPNDYTVEVVGKNQVPVAADITASVRAGETEYFSTKFTWNPNAKDPAKIHLPASLWTKLPADVGEVTLTVTARDPKNGAIATLSEPIKLLAPVNATFLVTDKPLYRPGEPVFFRSVTLDRTTFRPPARDLTLRYEITPANDPAKANVIAKVTGRAEPVRPAADGRFEPVIGPDGQPVRGVASGVFQLAKDLAGGEYVLTVYEVPANHPTDAKRPETVALATRKFTVLKYQEEKLLKTLEFDARTYGPGETVRAKLTVHDQAKPVAMAYLSPEVKGINVSPAPTDTAADGTATITFTLPNDPDLPSASLSVNVAHGTLRETIVRPIPIAPRTLVVEFFPEGGDLVTGVPNRVYFRATTPSGKSADIDGYLTDGTRSITPVKTVTDPDHPGANQGLGDFTFTPEPGKRYAVKLLRPTNVAESIDVKAATVVGGWAAAAAGVYPLPKAVANGVVMTIPEGVADAGQPIRVTLRSNDRRDLYVGAYARGVPVAAGKVTVEPGKPAEVILTPRAGTVGGVTRVTVFEEPDSAGGRSDLTPVAERLIYRRPADGLRLRIAPDRPGYAPGDAVNIAVTATKETGEPTAAILLVAVINQSVLTMADDRAERHLPTHFLLAGEVRKPDDLEHADFFLTDHPKAARSLDLLLGTQGWRRFAEQAPGRFRATVGQEEKDRFLVSAGVRPNLRASGIDPAADRFVPEYRQAARDYAAAGLKVREAWNQTAGRLQEIEAREQANQAVLTSATDFTFYSRIESRRDWLPAAVAAGLVIGIGALLRPVRRVAGRAAVLAGVGLVVISAFLLVADLTTRNATDWRGRVALMTRPPESVPQPELQPGLADGRDLIETARNARPPVVQAIAAADDPAFLTKMDAPLGARVGEWLKDPSMPDGLSAADPRDLFERAVQRHRLTEGGEATPNEKATARKVARQVVRHSPFVAREYAHTRTAAPEGDTTRTDFTETVLWHPLLVLPQDGKGSVSFTLSDSVQAYRVLVAGHTLDGRLGATSGLVEVRKPLAVDVKLPAEVTAGDRIDLPLTVANGTATNRDAKLSLWSDHLTFPGDAADRSLLVPPRGSAGVTVPLTVPARPGVARVRAGGTAGAGLADAVERTVSVVPDGFPASDSAAGVLERKAAATVTLPDQLVPGTLTAKVVVYTNAVAEVRAGLDGLLREPHGCFEQSSTANYPNVLILDYLKEIGKHNPTVVANARGLLERGYARLLGFEVMKKAGDAKEGFEWFGQFPPHEPLSAYGLMQFADMARVYPVDPGLLARTKDYLLARRDGTGGFQRPAVGHAFGDVPQPVTEAYIVWAITEAERGSPPSDIGKELAAAAKAALDTGDPYHLALAANALLNRREFDRAGPLLVQLAAKQSADGSVPGAAHTITRSAGPDLVTETTALSALAWLKVPPSSPFAPNARSAVKYLHSRRAASGAFGATQATILTLKALTEFARANRKPQENGRVVVRIDGKEVGAAAFNTDSPEPATVEIANPEKLLRAGPNAVEVECTGTADYPFAVSWSAATRKPASDPACVVKLTTALDAAETAEGRPVRLSVRLQNTSAAGQGMAVAVVGLPAGLKLPPDAKQLKDLTTAGTVAHWELTGRELVLYWRGLAPKQTAAVDLDLIADVPGEYRGPAGRAYLYYHPQAKAWVDPLAVRIRPASP